MFYVVFLAIVEVIGGQSHGDGKVTELDVSRIELRIANCVYGGSFRSPSGEFPLPLRRGSGNSREGERKIAGGEGEGRGRGRWGGEGPEPRQNGQREAQILKYLN